ncbi:MAG: hypothetical protein KC420_00335 [Myxococcales bacterium]|nr:hypothetical protein [Myxococcales bacterium]MCB9566657.1 hypothetical protein [Myxococcales bacterium]MCB9704388.1 hypothetical protein [Myxococcales bacterium]
MSAISVTEPLRIAPLPHPHRRIERRRNRPSDTSSALISAFDHAVARAELDAALLVDEEGMLVTKSSTSLDLNQLAAITPIVGRGLAEAAIKRNGQEREFSVRQLEILGETLFVAALGGQRGPRERETLTIAAAADRILNQ